MNQPTTPAGKTVGTPLPAPTGPRASRVRSLVALVLGLLPPFLVAVVARLSQGRGFTLHEMIAYPLVIGGAFLLVMLALLRYVCGEPLSALNQRRGSAAHDIAAGAVLAVAFAVFTFAALPFLARLGAPHRNPDAMTLVVGLLENPILLLVWFGPVLWIGVASFEEVARVFCMGRIAVLWPGVAGRWSAVAVSTTVFGLMHYYQGPSGVITTGVMGLALALYYVRSGRIWPLIIGHALYDAWSLGFGLVMLSRTMR